MWICDHCGETNDGKATECAHCGPTRQPEESLWHPAQSPEPASDPAQGAPYIPAGSEEHIVYRSTLHDVPPSHKPTHEDDPEPTMPVFGDEAPPYIPINPDAYAPNAPIYVQAPPSLLPPQDDRPEVYESVGRHVEMQLTRIGQAVRTFVIAPVIVGCAIYFNIQAIISHQAATRYQSECSETGKGTSSGSRASTLCSHVDRPVQFRLRDGARGARDIYASFTTVGGQKQFCRFWRHSGFDEKLVTPDYLGDAVIWSKVITCPLTLWRGRYTEIEVKGVHYPLDDNPRKIASDKRGQAGLASLPLLFIASFFVLKRLTRQLNDVREEKELRDELSRPL